MLPNVPTFDEPGVPGMYASAWYGVVAPAGTPKQFGDFMNSEVDRYRDIVRLSGARME